jgi:hypothetical protein
MADSARRTKRSSTGSLVRLFFSLSRVCRILLELELTVTLLAGIANWVGNE